jgi:hypothetical protein
VNGWILVNGVKVDLADFEASCDKANDQVWEKVIIAVTGRTVEGRCLICGDEIPRPREKYTYRSPAGVLCSPCFDRFVGPSTPP